MTYQTSNTPATFDIDLETVAFAVARNQCGAKIPIDDLLTELGLTPTEFLEFADDPIFKRSVQLFAKEMTENGVSFQMKARLQAEELLKSFEQTLGTELVTYILKADQSDDARIEEQRGRVALLKEKLGKSSDTRAKDLVSLADNLVKKSVWIMGGDGECVRKVNGGW